MKINALPLYLAAFFCLAFVSRAGAEDGRPAGGFRFSVDYWMSNIRAEARYGGDRFSFDEDLSMSPGKGIPVFELGFDSSGGRGILLSHFSPSYSGRDSSDRDIKFGGVTFPAGTEVDYEMRMSFTDVFYVSRLADISENRLDILFGVKIAGLSLELAGIDEHPGVHRRVKEDFLAPVPLVGLRFSVKLPRGFGFELQGRGLTLPIEGYRFDMLDANAALNYELHENFRVSAGYKVFIVNADVDDFEARSNLDGFFLRGIFRY